MKLKSITLMMLLMLTSCRTVELNNVEALTSHPQFPAAATNAPAWTKKALRTVAELEYEIERR